MDIKQEDLIKFWTWVFGKDKIEIHKSDWTVPRLYIYHRTTWNEEDKEWNIDPIEPIPDLNALYKYTIPKLQDKGYDTILESHLKDFNASIINRLNDYYTTISASTADTPTEALYNAIMKVIENDKTE